MAHLRAHIQVLGQSIVSDELPFVDLLQFVDLSLYNFGDICEQYCKEMHSISISISVRGLNIVPIFHC
jgi:hypothetical protein